MIEASLHPAAFVGLSRRRRRPPQRQRRGRRSLPNDDVGLDGAPLDREQQLLVADQGGPEPRGVRAGLMRAWPARRRGRHRGASRQGWHFFLSFLCSEEVEFLFLKRKKQTLSLTLFPFFHLSRISRSFSLSFPGPNVLRGRERETAGARSRPPPPTWESRASSRRCGTSHASSMCRLIRGMPSQSTPTAGCTAGRTAARGRCARTCRRTGAWVVGGGPLGAEGRRRRRQRSHFAHWFFFLGSVADSFPSSNAPCSRTRFTRVLRSD